MADHNYPVAELEAALLLAFVEHHADYIVIVSRFNQFLHEGAAYGQEQGWLGDVEVVELDEQSTEWRLRLTEKGREHFGLAKKVA
jgi:hypothetical protein